MSLWFNGLYVMADSRGPNDDFDDHLGLIEASLSGAEGLVDYWVKRAGVDAYVAPSVDCVEEFDVMALMEEFDPSFKAVHTSSPHATLADGTIVGPQHCTHICETTRTDDYHGGDEDQGSRYSTNGRPVESAFIGLGGVVPIEDIIVRPDLPPTQVNDSKHWGTYLPFPMHVAHLHVLEVNVLGDTSAIEFPISDGDSSDGEQLVHKDWGSCVFMRNVASAPDPPKLIFDQYDAGNFYHKIRCGKDCSQYRWLCRQDQAYFICQANRTNFPARWTNIDTNSMYLLFQSGKLLRIHPEIRGERLVFRVLAENQVYDVSRLVPLVLDRYFLSEWSTRLRQKIYGARVSTCSTHSVVESQGDWAIP